MIALALPDSVIRFLRRFDVDKWEGDEIGPYWICWGWCRVGPVKKAVKVGDPPRQFTHGRDRRYFFVRLPVFEWCERSWAREAGFMQRGWFWFEGLSWRYIHVEPRRG